MSQGLHKLGAQLEGALGNRDKWLVPNRVYHFPLRWDEVELTQGVYTFPSWAFETITQLDNKLGHDNYQLVIGLKCTPAFYSLPPHARNSPPSPPNYGKFVTFCEAVCMAFHPDGIEIYNEPEFTVLESAKWPEFFGGWGDMGSEYGEMVRILYDYLHTRHIDTKVIAGASFGFVNLDRALDFLREAVEAGMKSDYWSWHGYVHYSEVIYGTRAFYSLPWFSEQAYQIYPVPQIMSEVSVTRDSDKPEIAGHRNRQADLLRFLLDYQQRENNHVESIWWYTLADNNWMHTDLVAKGIAYPVYEVWSKT